jgi:hypothetical protein
MRVVEVTVESRYGYLMLSSSQKNPLWVGVTDPYLNTMVGVATKNEAASQIRRGRHTDRWRDIHRQAH